MKAVAFGKETEIFLIVVVPVVAPSINEVALPPIFTVATPELKRLALFEVEVILPPLTARFPSVDISPLAPVILKWVAVIFPAPSAKALAI